MIFLPAVALALAASPVAVAGPISSVILQQDITSFLSSNTASSGVATTYFMANISPAGTVAGAVIASPSTSNPNYFYHWVRDAALTMNVVNTMYANGNTALESELWAYAAFRAQQQSLNTLTGLGEPKFYADGRTFNDGWCRPQTDGPALTASTLVRFANAYLANGGDINKVQQTLYPIITKDLDYITTSWYSMNYNCDLWEEVRASDHFYTRMVQRRALQEGIQFVNQFGDTTRANTYATQSWNMGGPLDSHFTDSIGHIVESLGITSVPGGIQRTGLDAGTILAVIHTDTTSGGAIGQFSPIDDRVQATVPQYIESFRNLYKINSITSDSAGRTLGLAVGRYAEDVYNGINTSQGNPWFLTTLAVSELYYRMINHHMSDGNIVVTARNLPFFHYIGVKSQLSAGSTYASGSQQFTGIINSLAARADEFVRRVQFHSATGRLTEEYSRDTGVPVGAADLTWSYAALFTATWQRNNIQAF